MPMPRMLRLAAAGAILVLGLAACEMTLRLETRLEGDASGTFTVAMLLDREFLEGLRAFEELGAPPGEDEPLAGLSTLTAFFECLESAGWNVTQREPDGGLSLEASRPFASPDAFDDVLASMRCRDEAEDGIQLSNLGLEIDLGTERSFLRSTWFLRGSVDLRGPALDEESRELLQSVAEAAADVFTLEIAARLPGSIAVREGGGVVEEGRVSWTPRLGRELVFSARSSRIRAGSVAVIVGPVVALAGLGVWLLARRRRPEPEGPFGGAGIRIDDEEARTDG